MRLDLPMRLFRRFRLSRAARRYAGALGPRLRRDFGASDHYTPQQIEGAARTLGLDPRYIALGYARFLPEASFAALAAGLPIALSYAAARKLYEAAAPSPPVSSTPNPEQMNSYIGGDLSD